MTQGAHATGFNDCSIGICLVGGISDSGESENNFTKNQFTTLKSLCMSLPIILENSGVEILGHRDLPDVAKDCPCFDVRDWLAK